MISKRVIQVVIVSLVVAAIGYAQYAQRGVQKEILTKLDKIDKDQTALLARVQGSQPQQIDPNKVYDIPIADSAVRGPKGALVTITMFSDFQCPYCKQAAPVVEEVLKAYPNDVNFVMKQFPLPMHSYANPAARAAIAAGKQGKFWEAHDELYKSNLSPEAIRGIAEKLGLDMQKFQADMDSEEVKKQVQAETALGSTVNVRGTPTFFMNGKAMQARTVDAMKTLVAEELRKKGKAS
ncbi:MAG: thioredoxin domain-containing protein [Deltaproteobacteria bacterium]|nr:thioredoxin domain-containing protein [Deltaproteobacteria bacterium]